MRKKGEKKKNKATLLGLETSPKKCALSRAKLELNRQ